LHIIKLKQGITVKMHPSMIRLVAGSIISLSLLLIVGGYSYHYFSKAHDAEKWVAHTHEVINIIESLQGHAASMETNQRGHLLTNEKSFLNELQKDKTSVYQELAELDKSISDNSIQKEYIPILYHLIKTRIETLESVLEKHHTNPQEALILVRSGIGQREMTSIKDHLHRMKELELTVLPILII
jgi:CHASE3 domain sensor protein